jgi:hypothetical protein
MLVGVRAQYQRHRVELLQHDGHSSCRGTGFQRAGPRRQPARSDRRSKKTFKRDELGQAIEVSEYNAQGVLLDHFKNTFDGRLLLTTQRKVYREDGSLASTNLYEAEKKRSETTTYQPDGSITNKTVRTAQQLEQYGPDGSLQKTGTISVEHRLLDEVVLNKDGSRKKESNAPHRLDAHGNWTKLTRWQTDSQGTRPLSVAYRTLTYYVER